MRKKQKVFSTYYEIGHVISTIGVEDAEREETSPCYTATE